jgi:hypothetical protein
MRFTTRVLPALALAVLALTGCAGVAVGPALPAAGAASPPPAASSGQDLCHAAGVTYCALNPAVTQATIAQTICVHGWTATVRPSVSYTDSLKRQQLAQFASQHAGDARWTTRGTEEDHRMPLELGGAPSDSSNLSPEEPASPNPKDQDETSLRDQVCAGQLSLTAAQTQLRDRWLLAWPGYRA